MNNQLSEIYKLFGILSAEAHGLLLVEKDNLEAFVRFIDPSILSAFAEYKQLIPPPSVDSVNFRIWIECAIRRLGVTQKKICEDFQIEPARFSKFLNAKCDLDREKKLAVFGALKSRLSDAGLIRK